VTDPKFSLVWLAKFA